MIQTGAAKTEGQSRNWHLSCHVELPMIGPPSPWLGRRTSSGGSALAYRVDWEKTGALALASALACSGVQACGRSGRVRGAYSVSDKGGPVVDFAGYEIRNTHYVPRPNARTPEHPGPAPEPSPDAWARWWRSRRRPQTARHTIWLKGRPVLLFREALLPGWQYPCTDSELEAALRELPAAWTARLRSVRLTFHPEWDASARTDRSRVEISSIVDASLHAAGEVFDDTPEEVDFGARLEVWDGTRRIVWPDRDTLRLYLLRHVLIHELGHHVAPPGLRRGDEEDWAEAFAYRFYTPPAAKHGAANR
jgi:hypothetical protein